MLDMWVPFPALSSAFNMFRDKLQLFHSCKINTEILGLTVLPVSTGHRLIQELWSRDRSRQCKCCINKRIPCCVSKSTSRCGLRPASMIFCTLHVYLCPLHGATPHQQSLHISHLLSVFILEFLSGKKISGTTFSRRLEARNITV